MIEFRFTNILHFLFYWYNFLKIVQKPGNIEKLDFLFHRSGPQIGQPRGYAFVTYKTERDAMPDGTDAELVGAAEREENEAETDVAEDAEADTAELRLKEVLAALDEATLEGAATTAVTSKRL